VNKINISIVLIGNSEKMFSSDKLIRIKSDLFRILPIQKIDVLIGDGVEDGYLDRKYSKADLIGRIKNSHSSDFTVGIMQERFIDGFYMHRLARDCGIISLYGIQEILEKRNISLDDFIKKSIYEIVGMWVYCGDLESDDVYNLVHRHTKGCVFDLNGDHNDIIYNTISPILCGACAAKFHTRQIDSKFLDKFRKELSEIKKPFLIRAEEFIRRYPLLSILSTAFGSILLNLFASAIWEFLTK
jgi:hypothetical protein